MSQDKPLVPELGIPTTDAQREASQALAEADAGLRAFDETMDYVNMVMDRLGVPPAEELEDYHRNQPEKMRRR